MKIRAAVLEEFGQPLKVQALDLAEPKAGEVLVRLAACGVCHDLYTASGADPSGYAPCVLGHEGAGVVEALGADVTSLGVGDHVVTLFAPECGKCVHCRSGRTNRCVAIRDQQGLGYLPDGTTRLSRSGSRCGTSWEPRRSRSTRDAGDRAREGVAGRAARRCAPFACGLSTGIGAALYTAQVEPGTTCAVFGCGLVGLGAVIGARLAGAERIIAIDLSEDRLAQARHHGATHARRERRRRRLDPRGDGRLRRRLHVRGHGQRAGHAAGCRKRARPGVSRRWSASPARETLDIVPRFLITGRRVTGSSFGGVKGRTQVPLVDRWLGGEIDVDSLLSHRLPLDDVNRGFELMEAQDGIRSVIVFG